MGVWCTNVLFERCEEAAILFGLWEGQMEGGFFARCDRGVEGVGFDV